MIRARRNKPRRSHRAARRRARSRRSERPRDEQMRALDKAAVGTRRVQVLVAGAVTARRARVAASRTSARRRPFLRIDLDDVHRALSPARCPSQSRKQSESRIYVWHAQSTSCYPRPLARPYRSSALLLPDEVKPEPMRSASGLLGTSRPVTLAAIQSLTSLPQSRSSSSVASSSSPPDVPDASCSWSASCAIVYLRQSLTETRPTSSPKRSTRMTRGLCERRTAS